MREAHRAFSGLELASICEDIRQQLEADLVGFSQVLVQYEIETEEDYQTIRDVDLERALDIIDGAASRAITAELDRIVAELDAGCEKLPVEAIREAREHRDLIIPRLIKVLQDTAADARAGDLPEGNAHFFALFLLTEFRAQEGLPAIIEAISLPGELPFEVFGDDTITEWLDGILAQFAGDSPQLLDDLIDDQKLNEYVRREAAQTYIYLVRDGCLSRDEAVECLSKHLRTAVRRNDSEIAGALVAELTNFAPEEALEDITEAFDRELVDIGLVGMESVQKSIAEGEARVQRALQHCGPTGIEDTIAELQHWAAFEEKPAPPRTPQAPRPHFVKPCEPIASAPATVTSRRQHVGRNDPCPCGSGKKYKKCCGRRM